MKQPRKGARIEDSAQPFEDLQLGPLLGQGSFGRVYRGMWSGAPVAVKVSSSGKACELVSAAHSTIFRCCALSSAKAALTEV